MANLPVELTDDATIFRSGDWSTLVEADPSGTFFHTPAYLKLWWEEFGSGSLAVARVHGKDGPMAACAFEVVERSLRFLGGFDVTDYMGPVGRPGHRREASRALVEAMTDIPRWDRADLRGMSEDSPWRGYLEEAARELGLGAEPGDDGGAPMLHLPETYDAYLAALPSKLRHEIRRKERRLVAEAGPYAFRVSSPETLVEDMDRFMELHRSSPGPKGKFMHAGMEIFFRRLGEAFLAPHVFHLALLELGDGDVAAGAIGFAYKNTFSLYNSSFDRAIGTLSPGMVLVGELIRRAILEGRTVFDLLKGDLEYKHRFGAEARPVGSLLISR